MRKPKRKHFPENLCTTSLCKYSVNIVLVHLLSETGKGKELKPKT